jgi:polyhydroxyalkanoate synthesis repressor PhaR
LAIVIRHIRRYGSRKLYDTEESRYVSLEEVGELVRRGQEVQVVDTQSGEDVTAQTLAQVILEESKGGVSPISSQFLHTLIRRGEEIVTTGVEQLSTGVDRLLQASVDRVTPIRDIRDEVRGMRQKIDALEHAIGEIEEQRRAPRRTARSESGKKKGA